MKKEITIYELLGLIKDDNKPNKIRYDSHFWNLKKEFNDYFDGEKYLIADGFDVFFDNAKEFLNDKVEIIEEPKQLEEIEIENDNTSHFYIRDKHGTRCQMTKHSKIITEKVNEIIRYIKDKENK